MSETLVQVPMKRELDAGLTLLSEKYNFTVLPYHHNTVMEEKDCTPAPSAVHAISWRKRILWLSEGDDHFEWLHEVAHLVCCPPWEDGPNDANEFGGIFAWERAVGREFYRMGIWEEGDWDDLLIGQNMYATTRPTRGGGVEWCDWSGVRLWPPKPVHVVHAQDASPSQSLEQAQQTYVRASCMVRGCGASVGLAVAKRLAQP